MYICFRCFVAGRMRRDDVLPDDIDSLWDPYVKGSGSRTGGGSGLGLFVVRTILDKYGLKGRLSYHDGTFSVEIGEC